MKEIMIGREGQQPFIISDEYVSRQHALLSVDESTGAMVLTDRSRPEAGTFVKSGGQWQRIRQCQVAASTEVRLGPYFAFRISQAVPQSVQKPKVERVDISRLRTVAEQYESSKIMLEQKQTNINGLRTLSLIGSLAGAGISGMLVKVLGSDTPVWVQLVGPFIAIVFLVSLMVYCSHASKEVIMRRTKNDKQYRINFCCPKCHLPFAGKLYENILAEGKCPKCKTEYYDANI